MILNGTLDFTFFHPFSFHFTLSFCISCHRGDDDGEARAARQSQVHRNLLRLWRTDRRCFCATVHRLISGSLLRAAKVSDMWRQFGISEALIVEFQQPFIDKKTRQLWQTWHFFSCWGVVTGVFEHYIVYLNGDSRRWWFSFFFLLSFPIEWCCLMSSHKWSAYGQFLFSWSTVQHH